MNFRSVWNRFLRLLSIRQPRSKREASASLNLEKLEDRVNPSGLFLTQSEVQELADAAVDQWVEAGISQEQLEVLQNLNYQIADLGEHHLGQYRPGLITVDDNAAGRLWFVDATPDLNEEFVGEGNSFVAIEDTLAYRKIDLLTVLIHEQGHALGLTGQIGSVDDVMNETLQDGIRRLPILDQAEDAIPGSITTLQYLTTDETGSGQAHSTVQPYTAINYVIALEGLYPSRAVNAEPVLGAVEMFAGNFAPRGYALADGQILPIAQNTALFSILGTTYGGDGRTTFALPDLRGRAPIGAGQGPGLSNYRLGQKSGFETVTLNSSQLPSHSHTINGAPNTSSTGSTSTQPFENRQPTLALTPIVSTVGIYPSRSLSGAEYLGSISWFAGNFAPRGYALANGDLEAISQNDALFSLFGTIYGGDGRTTFGLPDLRGRMAIHAGSGPGLSPVRLGEKGGTENSRLTVNNLPSHNHGLPGGGTTNNTGGSQGIENRHPYLAVNYVIATQGVFPSRNLDAGETANEPESNEPPGTGFISGDRIIDEAEARELIEALVQTGIRHWKAAGITDEQAEQLENVEIEIADLQSGRLAGAGGNRITLDRDASNRGWFIDATPDENEEFGEIDSRTGELVATVDAAYRHYDLLTAIMHEQGHILGLEHAELPGQLMYGGLSIGGRIIPTASDLVPSDEDHSEETFLSANPALASIAMFGGNFNPRGWAFTNGQILPINQNQSLYSLLGTTYGGDGRTTYGLPELRGRAAIGAGEASSGTTYRLGQKGGAQSIFLTSAQIPAHTHESTADFGDAPDTGAGTGAGNYETLAANGGPSHIVVAGLHLGAEVDTEFDAQQNANADGDDTSQTPDDEDGVIDLADLEITVGTTPSIDLQVTNTTGSSATLYGWIDYNNDGFFDNASERASVTVDDGTTDGTVTLTFSQVPGGFTGTTYARFRLSTNAAASNPGGIAPDGEVEDYQVTILSGNSAPTLVVDDLLYTEGDNSGNPVPIDSTATANDPDGDADWAGGSLTVQITNNNEAADEISITAADLMDGGVTFGTIVENSGTANDGVVTNGDLLTINFNSNATNARVQSLVRAISYRTTSDFPSELDRTVTFTATDTNGNIGTDTSTISVTGTAENTVEIVGGNLVLSNSGATINNDFTISFDGTDITLNDTAEVIDIIGTITGATGSGTNTVVIPVSQITGTQIIVNGLEGNDSLTIEIGTSNYTKQILFNGGNPTTGSGDSLTLTSLETFDDLTFNYTNESDGTIDLTGNQTITYTGLEPIDADLTATNVTLNYSATAETITVSAGTAGRTVVDSESAGEITTFNNPTGTLTIETNSTGSAGVDTVNVQGLGSGFAAALVIDADENDTVNFQTNATNTGSGELTVTAGTLNINSGVTTTGSISLNVDSIAINSSVSGGDLTIAPLTPSRSIGLGGGAGDLNLGDAELANLQDGFTSIVIGDATNGSGTITVDSSTFTDPVTIASPSGTISVVGQITGSGDASITLDGPSTLSADLVTSGNAINLNDAVTLGADVNLDTTNSGGSAATTVQIDGAVQGTTAGQESLTIDGDATLNGAIGTSIALEGLTINGTADLNVGTVTTTGDQLFNGNVTLSSDTTSNAANVTFEGTIDGNQSLNVNTTGGGVTTFKGEIGGTNVISSLTTNSDGSTRIAANISADGSTVTFNDSVILTGDVTITDSGATGVNFNNTLDSDGTSRDLTINTTGGGSTGFHGVVGGVSALDQLITDASGTTTIDTSEVSASSITLNDSVTVSVSTTLSADEIDFNGGADSVSGTVALTLAPLTSSESIGVGGGAGTLDISDTDLAALADGFTSITIGDSANGSGAVDVDSSTFDDPITIVGGTISVTELNGGVNAVTLTARTGAITDGGDSGTDITGGAVTLQTLDATTGDIGAGGDAISLSANSLVTDSSASGDGQFLSEADSLTWNTSTVGSGTVTLTGGRFNVGSSQTITGDVQVNSGATLGGTGTIAGAVTAANNSNVSPGTSPGALSTGNLNLQSGATLDIEIEGTGGAGAANGHDQVNVTGTVTLAGDLQLSGAFTPAVNDSFVIINNDSDDAVSGTFNGLSEGDFVNFNGIVLTITYQGGDGNDVVLELIPETEVTLVGGVLTITDVNGGTSNDDLTLSFAGGTYTLTDAGGLPIDASSITGATGSGSSTVTFPGADVTSIVFDTLGGNDSITIASVQLSLAGGFTINDSAGTDSATINGAISTGAGAIAITSETITTSASLSGTDITLTTDSLSLGANVSGSGNLTLSPLTDNASIGIGGGAGAFNIDDAELAFLQDGFAGITIGDSTNGSGAVDIDSSTFDDPITIVGGTISVTELNAGVNAVTLTARTGAITDGGDSGTDITGGAVTLQTLDATTGDIGVGGDAISLSANSLVTDSSASGDGQFLSEADSVTMTNINAAAGTLTISGGEFDLSNDAIANATSVTVGNGATLDVNGATDTLAGVSILSGGSLIGAGTLTSPITVANGGTVSPGTSPGIIGTGDLTLNSGADFEVEIQNGAPGTGHDQLVVTGVVDLGGADLNLDDTGFTSNGGEVIVLIANDGTDAVVGTFNGLPDGSLLTLGGQEFILRYDGGDGNDVVLSIAPDFGDALLTHGTATASHGVTGPTIGVLRDAEAVANISGNALGDDNADDDDEDGITFTETFIVSDRLINTARFEFELQNADPTSNRLDAFIDFNGDGDFNDPGEKILDNFDLGTTNGTQTIEFEIPQDVGPNVIADDVFARFRLSTTGGLNAIEAAADGEVEDYRVSLVDSTAFEMQRRFGFYDTGNNYFNSGGCSELWFKGSDNLWYFIKPNGQIFRWGGAGDTDLSQSTLIGRVDPSIYSNLDQLFNTVKGSTPEPLDVIQEAFGFFDTGNDYFNSGGQNEKWFKDRNGADYFIKPDGTIWRWGGSGDTDLSQSVCVAKSTVAAYDDPSLIFNALN